MTRAFHLVGLADSHFHASCRFDECVRVHDLIADYIEHEKPDAVLHAGDVNDGSSTPEERLHQAHFFRRSADVCPNVIAKGNHDRKLDLLILAELAAKHPIRVVETDAIVSVGDAQVATMAWPSRVGTLDEGSAREALSRRLLDLGLRMAEKPGPRILLGHFDIRGAKVGAGQPVIGGALTIGTEDLARAKAHATICGHIHASQEWIVDDRPIVYPGSPYHTDFGDPMAKSFVSAIIEGDRVRWERIPIDARPMLLFEAVWERFPMGGAGFVGSALSAAPYNMHAQWLALGGPSIEMADPDATIQCADIRFRFRVTADEFDNANARAKELQEHWLTRGASTVKLDPEVLATTRARAPEIAQARSLEDKLRAYWVAKEDVPEVARQERLFDRIATLEAP